MRGSPYDALAEAALFSNFSPTAREALREYFAVLEGNAGDRLYEQGDDGDGLYVIAEGNLFAVVRDIEGAEHSVARLSRGDSFGELALLLRGERLVTITASTDVVLLELSMASFRSLKHRNPDLCLMLIMAIVRKFGHVLDGSRDVLQRLLLRQLAGLDDA